MASAGYTLDPCNISRDQCLFRLMKIGIYYTLVSLDAGMSNLINTDINSLIQLELGNNGWTSIR